MSQAAEWHFFATSNGKGPCGCATDVMKWLVEHDSLNPYTCNPRP